LWICGLAAGIALPGEGRTAEPDVRALLDQVDPANLQADTERLVAFDTRFMGSDSNAAAALWLGDRLDAMGYRAELDSFDLDVDRTVGGFRWILGGQRQANVVAIRAGTLYPERKIVLGAHYDSISLDLGPAGQGFAPGADDNASGLAAVLEMARLLADVPLDVTVEFAFFGAEELGLVGSRARARAARAADEEIVVMLQIDSIGSRSDLFPDAFSIDTTHPHLQLGLRVADAAAAYTDIRARNGVGGSVTVTTRGCQCSDHQSYLDEGFPALGIFQYDPNPTHLNTSEDTMAHIDVTLVEEVTKAALASVLELGGFPGRSADFDGDGTVSFPDFVLFADRFGNEALDPSDEPFDLDRDERIGFSDFVIFSDRYGKQL